MNVVRPWGLDFEAITMLACMCTCAGGGTAAASQTGSGSPGGCGCGCPWPGTVSQGADTLVARP